MANSSANHPATFARLLAFAALLALSCSESARRNPLPSMRLSPAQVVAEGVSDPAALVDRDASRRIALPAATRIAFRFEHAVEIRRVKILATAGVTVSAAGASATAGAGWTSLDLPSPVTSSELSLAVTPAKGASSIAEVEAWGAGFPRAPRDPLALARATAARDAAFEDIRVLRAPAETLALSPPGAASGDACASTTFPATQPRQARRAYLVYEANLPRSVSLQRSVNGEAPLGGFWVGGASETTTLVDELDPETLRTETGVLLCLPLEASAPVTVRDLRLVLVLDAGDSYADRETIAHAGALLDGDPSTSAPVAPGPLDVGLDRAIEIERAELRVASETRLEAVDSFDGERWSSAGAVSLDAGDGALPLGGSVAQTVRLGFAPGPRPDLPAATVSEVALAGSGVGPRIGAPRIVVTYPALRYASGREIGERFADRAYVAGWAESPGGRGTVEVDGVRVDTGGAFAMPLERPAGATGSWAVVLHASFPDGREVTRTILLDDDRGATAEGGSAQPFSTSLDQLYGRENMEARGIVDRVNGGKVSLGSEVSVEVPAGAVNGATTLGITRKGHESMPPLDAGMINVTAPPHFAYRFLPKGQQFAKPVKVTLPFDPSLLPEGVGMDEIKTYYFDEAQDHWFALPRFELQASTHRVVSETTHFTFMINAVLVLPDHPGPVSFDPNSIKDLKAAVPSAGLDLVQAPEANAMGTAQLALPVRLPPARGAHQPVLKLAYDSSAGNGWVGVGWDLPVPSVQIDTRFGVHDLGATDPRYLLEGAQIVPTGERGRCEGSPNADGDLYRERVAREFSRIVRCGSSARTYWFEVSDRNGTLFVYGYGQGRLRSPRPDGSIGQWFLERVVDANGNLVEYRYDQDYPTIADQALHREPFRQVYLRSVRYTGRAARVGAGAVFGGTPGPYVIDVQHQRDSDGQLRPRPDAITSARLGFKVLTRRLLGTILVSRGTSRIREYELSYGTGFGKSRLEKVATFGFQGSTRMVAPYEEHGFEYEDPDTAYNAFGSTTTPWSFAEEDRDQLVLAEEHAESKQGGLGIDILGIVQLGGNKGKASSSTDTKAMLADVNGDGLPDRLTYDGGVTSVVFNRGLSGNSGTFTRLLPPGDPAAETDPNPFLVGLPSEHGKSDVTNYRAGFLHIIGASEGTSRFSSEQSTTLQDFDGDGFLDWANGYTVYLARGRDEMNRGFEFYPWRGNGVLPDVPTSIEEVLRQFTNDNRRPSDVVLEWIAPYAGDVDVTGWLSIRDNRRPPPDPDWDGVRLRVYRANEVNGQYVTEQLGEFATDVSHIGNPIGVALSEVAVQPGSRLYFTLSTLSDFPVYLEYRSPIEEAEFAPLIAYRNVPAADRDRVEPNGAKAFVFDSSADFRLGGGGPQAVVAPATGRVQIQTTIVKKPSTDDVRYCIQKFPESAQSTDEPCQGTGFTLVGNVRPYSASADVVEPFDVETIAGYHDRIVFRIESDLSIDPADVEWHIGGRMTMVVDQQGIWHTVHDSVTQYASFVADAYVRLHVSIDAAPPATGTAATPDPVPLLPLVVPADGTLTIVTRQDNLTAPATTVWLAARTKDALVFKHSAADAPRTITIPVTSGEEIFFEAHSEVGEGLSWTPTVTLRSGGQDRVLDASEVPLNFTRDEVVDASGVRYRIASSFAGGYHGWRHGAWHGANDEPFDPNVLTILLPYIQNGLWSALQAALDIPGSPESRAISATSPLFPRRLGTYVNASSDGLRPNAPAWVSKERTTFVTADTMHASRESMLAEGAAGMRLFRTSPPGTLRASTGKSELVGVDLFDSLFGFYKTSGGSDQNKDVIDMDGDGLLDSILRPPDIELPFGSDEISFPTFLSLVGLNDQTFRPASIISDYDLLRRNVDKGGTANIGKSMPFAKLSAEEGDVNAVVGTATVGAGVALGINLSSSNNDLVDVNGDGLPDVVTYSSSCSTGTPCFLVRLNLGAGHFGAQDVIRVPGPWNAGIDPLYYLLGAPTGDDPVNYGPNRVRRTKAVTLKSSVGLSFIVGFSKAWGSSIAQTQVMLVDVTGDGLPDYVRKGAGDVDHMHVMVNTGSGFLAEQTWRLPAWPNHVTQPFLSGEGLFGDAAGTLFRAATDWIDRIDAVETNGSWTPEASDGWGVSLTVPILPGVFISGSYGEEESTRATGLQLGMMDIDGDGLPDHVLKAEDRHDGTTNVQIRARLNQLGKANLLKRVSRPLGGKIDLFYARAGNTVAMPENRWVLDKVIVRDGRGSDLRTTFVTGHDIPTSYRYANGKRDRYEREFLGFGRVTALNADGGKIVREYRNDRFVFKGLLASERTEDASGRILVETVNEYRDPYEDADFRLLAGTQQCEAQRPFNLAADSWFCGSLFPALHVTKTRFYERQAQPRMEARQAFSYDVEERFALRGVAPNGNVVEFDDFGDANPANQVDDLHARIEYFGDLTSGIHSVSRPKSVVVTDARGAKLRQREAEYDDRGNLKHFTAWIDRTRTADTNLRWNDLGFLEHVEGPAGIGGRYTLDYGYDNVVHTYRTTTVDAHGYTSTTKWDYDFGEITDTTDVNGQTTKRTYDRCGRLEDLFGPYDASNAAIHFEYAPTAAVPFARTRHRRPEGGWLETVVFQDGLGRTIQTRKTAEVHERGVGWSVSGNVRFDAMGRVAIQGQAFFVPGTGLEYRDYTPLYPKMFAYDELGRTIWTREPIERDGANHQRTATTTVAYGFGTAGDSILRRAATVTDPENKVRVVFRDPADQVVGVEERDKGVAAVTRYVYDPVGQLTHVFDAAGNETTLGYDLLGRRTLLNNPDTGALVLGYDAAGNLIEKTDAKSQKTKYEYVFNQLRKINYPDGADVTYEYGPTGAPENGAGRVVGVTDDAGSETRGYGPLGELVRSTRTVRPFRPGDVDKVFETHFAFDIFGRMQWIIYPDGEKVTYSYDAGGLLESATGTRPPDRKGYSEEEKYVTSLTYDELGQRRRLVLGNGAVTDYAYYPESRRLSGVSTIVSGRKLQALAYRYDRVGNVLEMGNALPPATGRRSGPMKLLFGYDDLYRLTSATGTAESRPGVVDSFTASYEYNAIHNMRRNTQIHVVKTLGDPGEGVGYPPETNHDFEYDYSDPEKPHQATQIGETHVVYDANGNVERECRDSSNCEGNADHLRRFYWTEENRLAAVIDGNGQAVTRFVYDAAGERVAKLGRGGESLTIGQFFSLKGRKAAAKHVFVGASRIATKIDSPPGWQPATPEVIVAAAGEPPSGSTLPGCIPSHYNPHKCDAYPGGDPNVVGPPDDKIRPATYYYHPDHLGSTSWVSDQNGRVHEHVEYFPYGQVWRDVRADSDGRDITGQRFLFTSKELDEETGLYYFGARYYDPVRARWESTDPMLVVGSEYASSRPAALNAYAYAQWSPLRLIDPTGLADEEAKPGYWERFKEWVKEKIGLGDKVKTQGEVMQRALSRERLMNQIDGMGADSAVDSERNELNKQSADSLVDDSLEAAKFVAEEAAISKGLGVVGAVVGKAARGSTVIGKLKDLRSLRPGEKTLLKHLQGDLGGPKANWIRNAGVLRREMSNGLPIRDASVDAAGKLIDYPGSFLNAERNLLRSHGWTYDPATTLWSPP